MKTVVIEMNGRIAAGKSTVASHIINSTITQKYEIDDFSEIAKHSKLKRIIVFLIFAIRYPVFFFTIIFATLKRCRLFVFQGMLKKNIRIMEKWALASYYKGVYLIDEGISHKIKPDIVLKNFPKKKIKLVVIYVTADMHTRKKRIQKRINDNTRFKQSHIDLIQKPELFSKMYDSRLYFWTDIHEKYQNGNNSIVPCYIIDTTNYTESDEIMIDGLLKFLEAELKQ